MSISTFDQIQQDHKTSLASGILRFSGLLLSFTFVLFLGVQYYTKNISNYGYSTSNNHLEIIIANTALSIPENTIRFKTQRFEGVQNSIELYLHWPSFSGYTPELKSAFNRTGDLSNLIFVSIEPRSMTLDMSGRIGPIYARFFEGPAHIEGNNLYRQALSRAGGYIDEDLFYEAGSPYPFAARCVRENSSVGSPICIRDIHFTSDLMVTYRFHKKHLANWLSLDQSIRSFLDSKVKG